MPTPTTPAPVVSPIVTHPAPRKAASCSNSRGHSPGATFPTHLPRGRADQQSSRQVGLEGCRHRPQGEVIGRQGAPTGQNPGHTQRNGRTSTANHPLQPFGPTPWAWHQPRTPRHAPCPRPAPQHTQDGLQPHDCQPPSAYRPRQSGPALPLGTAPGGTSTLDKSASAQPCWLCPGSPDRRTRRRNYAWNTRMAWVGSLWARARTDNTSATRCDRSRSEVAAATSSAALSPLRASRRPSG